MARNKYKAKPTVVDGRRFASRHEARAYLQLKALQAAGAIRDLRMQVRFPIRVEGQLICHYTADFVYREVCTGQEVVADAKGYPTREYKLKRKLMLAVNNITILEL